MMLVQKKLFEKIISFSELASRLLNLNVFRNLIFKTYCLYTYQAY